LLFERLAGLTCDSRAQESAKCRFLTLLLATFVEDAVYIARESMHAWCAFMPRVNLTGLVLISRETSS